MNRSILVVFLTILSICSYSQSDLRIGINISPLTSFMHNSGWGFISRPGIGIGFNVDYFIANKTYICTGIELNKTSYYFRNVPGWQYSNENGEIIYVPNSEVRYSEYLIRTPLNLCYYFKNSIYSTIGFEFDYTIAFKNKSIYRDSTTIYKDRLNVLTYGINLGFGEEYEFKKFIFQIEPMYSFIFKNEKSLYNHSVIRLSFIIKKK